MPETIACEACGAPVASGLLWCPECHRLTHGERLKELAAEAETAERGGDFRGALVAWREALELLPPGTRQHEQVVARISSLGRQAESAASLRPAEPKAAGAEKAGWSGGAGLAGLGAIGVFLFKFKFLVFILLTKAKFLLLGLTKAGTFFSMLASFGLYWTVFGWKFALGLVLSIYVHEMGHVYLLHRYGVKASMPMFIPGFGALIRLKQAFHDVRQEARVGLAGPVWGLGAALACYGGSIAFASPVLAAIASRGAWINLFNLIPLWQLDGGHAFRAFSRSQRWLAAAVIALAWTQTHEGLLVFLMLAAAYRAISEPGAREPDRGAFLQFVVVVAALSALIMIPVAI